MHSLGLRVPRRVTRAFATFSPHIDLKRVRDHAAYKGRNVIERKVDCNVGAIVTNYERFVILSRELDKLRAGECCESTQARAI